MSLGYGFSKQESDDDAVVALLKAAKRSLRPDGCLIIAIENRLGLKYILGAHEDHYAQRHVGLANYANSTGIRTYDYEQWQSLLARAGFSHNECLLPFPDYKIPHTVIQPHETVTKDELKQSLKDIISRDYCAPLPQQVVPEQESLLWQGVIDAGALRSMSNSFMFVAGMSASSVTSRMPVDPISQYEPPQYAYLNPIPAETDPNIARIQALNARLQRRGRDIEQLEAHIVSLESQQRVILDSKRWRWVSAIKRWIGRG